MFYETAQTIGPGWHGKSFKPSHYDDLSWNKPTSTTRHFRSPGSSPTIRRRLITHDLDDDDDSEPRMFQRRSPTFDRKFFKDVWGDHPRREDLFEDRPSLFKRSAKHDWDRDVEDFENSLRRERDFRNDYQEPEDGDCDGLETGSGRVRHIPIMVEHRRNRTNDDKPYRSRCSSPPPPSPEKEPFVDESDEWLRHHMDRLKQNFDSGFSTMQNRHNRHRLPRVDLNCRPRAFTSPIPDWGPENVHTLPTRKHHSRVVLDEKRIPKSVFRSYSETHEDIPREHVTASRSHSDSHCPKTTYATTKVSVNVPPEKTDEAAATASNDDSPDRPVPPQRRTRCRPRREENKAPPQEAEQPQGAENCSEKSAQGDQNESKTKADEAGVPKTEADGDSKPRKNSLKDGRAANAFLQIAAVLQNVEDLLQHVEAYRGNGRDKQFRFLDEMLTRCILRLDDVDTDGMDDVRTARKTAVRQVQACIEKLESRTAEDRENNHNRDEPADEPKPADCAPDDESKRPDDEESNQRPNESAELPKRSSDEESKQHSATDTSSSEEAEQTRL